MKNTLKYAAAALAPAAIIIAVAVGVSPASSTPTVKVQTVTETRVPPAADDAPAATPRGDLVMPPLAPAPASRKVTLNQSSAAADAANDDPNAPVPPPSPRQGNVDPGSTTIDGSKPPQP